MNVAKKLATAIDIGTDSIKAVQLEYTSANFSFKKKSLIKRNTEEFSLSEVKIVNFGMGRYPRADVDAEVSDDMIVRTLRDVLSQANIKPKSVAISIPRALVTTKKLNFHTRTSALTEEEINEMVTLQAEIEIPFGANNAIYNYHNIQKSSEGMSVELVAARKETIAWYMGILKSADLQVAQILPSTYAIGALALNQLASNSVEVGSENTTMVIDIGAEYTDLCIIRSNRIAFSRSFPIGGDLLTKAYGQEQGLSFEEAEEYKISNASLESPPTSLYQGGEGGMATPTLRPDEGGRQAYEWASKLSEELRRSIQAFGRDMLGAEKVDSIWMCGCSAIIPGLDRYITDSLAIPTKLWNPFVAFESNLPAEPPENLKYSFAVSLGLALNTFTNQVTVNLLPTEEVQRKEKAKQRIFTLSYAAAALILIVGIFVGVNKWVSFRNTQLEAINAKLQAVQKSSEQTKNLLTDDLVMTQALYPRVSPLDVLKELSEKFPDRTKIALTNFTLDRTQKITINVEANSHEEISNLISQLDRSGLFTDVKSGQIATTEKQKDKQVLQAQITCKLSDNAVKYTQEVREKFAMASKKSQPAPEEFQNEGVIKRTSMGNPE
jgi:type IV pilus assembly protein PilM